MKDLPATLSKEEIDGIRSGASSLEIQHHPEGVAACVCILTTKDGNKSLRTVSYLRLDDLGMFPTHKE